MGILANSADAILYFAVDHDYLMATVSALDAVSMGATGKIAKAVGKGQKISKSAMYLKVTTSLLSNTLSFAKNTSMAGENLHKMYNKYIAEGHTFDWNDSETRTECYNLCLNLFGMAMSGKGMYKEGTDFGGMLWQDRGVLKSKISSGWNKLKQGARDHLYGNSLGGGRKSGSFSKGVGNPVEVVGRGSTGRTVPNTLNEQMAMHQVMSNPLEGAVDMSQLKNHPVIMSDSRWLASEGWVKMSNNVNGVEIHFVYNKITGAFDDFKFK